MDTSNRNNLLKLLGGLIFSGIFCYTFYQCQKKPKPDPFPNYYQDAPIRDSQEEWRKQLQAAKNYADTATQPSYKEYLQQVEQNDADYFMDHYDEYSADPDDQITYDPIIFDALRD